MATVGKNILDNLTTGMYSDSKVIYREYIQNACDQIDIAINSYLLSPENANIDIYIDHEKRYISIRDNATGVKESHFKGDVGDIANSNKEIGKNKGFRGIGRLCGLAYCKTLKFTTSYYGEKNKSIMTCDAKKMREMLIENKKYTLDEIWDSIVTYSCDYEEEKEHYFEVELIDINKENTDLLDTKKVSDYLSFVAPVPYKNTFILRNQIYEHAQSIGYKIDEYCIKINGAQIFKEYTTKLKEVRANGYEYYDEILKLEFKDFRDESGDLLAWMWCGLSRFEKQIPNINAMRGLRLRSSNIQLGNDDTLQFLFKESRGNYYFVGEVFAVSHNLIPNSQRNYFNENEARFTFEQYLRTYFYEELHKLYYEANRLKNDYKRQEDLVNKIAEYEKKEREHGFIDDNERKKFKQEIEKAKKDAEKARKRLDKIDYSDNNSAIAEVRKGIEQKYNISQVKKMAEDINFTTDNSNKKNSYITSDMSRLSRSERKLVSKILSIISNVAPKDIAIEIINKIKEELR